ncbi:MAG: UDP-N-acetylmuramoyl-L-alanine--D-glutamate ligase [Nitrospirota bacterium]|nr:UDP-N-acetylmuramoyl-L-alanine--D-glutamate ligase [Nitrospirota bacterium]
MYRLRSCQPVGILGAGKTARRLARSLTNEGLAVWVYEEHPKNVHRRALEYLAKLGVKMFGPSSEEKFLEGLSVLVPSPGFSFAHTVFVLALKRGIPWVGELDLISLLAGTPPKLLAVSGTNGKTSVCSWVQNLLSQLGQRVFRAGNEGPPFGRFLGRAGSFQVGVLETSSFQLAQSKVFRPSVVLLTEIRPDHLSWHGSFEAYQAAKLSVLERLGAKDTAIVLNPDPVTEKALQGGRSKVWSVGKRMSFAYGGLVWDKEWFYVEAPGLSLRIPLPNSEDAAFIPPENLLLAGLAAFELSGDKTAFSMLEGLRPLTYRISFERTLKGASIFNDSKATNVASVELALKLLPPPIVWIGGGLSKGLDLGPLEGLVREKVRLALFFGHARDAFADAVGDLVPSERFKTLEMLMLRLADVVMPEDRVLFSPGCASFDAFKSFRHRGFTFSKLLASLSPTEVI